MAHELNFEDGEASLIQEILGYYDAIEKRLKEFATFEMTKYRLDRYAVGVFPPPARRKGQSDRSFEETRAKVATLRQDSIRFFEEGKGNAEPGIRVTLWAAYNGVTELVDHHSLFTTPWQRMNSICFGAGEKLKHRALDEVAGLRAPWKYRKGLEQAGRVVPDDHRSVE